MSDTPHDPAAAGDLGTEADELEFLETLEAYDQVNTDDAVAPPTVVDPPAFE